MLACPLQAGNLKINERENLSLFQYVSGNFQKNSYSEILKIIT